MILELTNEYLRFLPFCSTDLSLNYNCLNEEIVEQYARSGKLETLSVKVYKNDPHYHKIPNCTWSRIKKKCPLLEVCALRNIARKLWDADQYLEMQISIMNCQSICRKLAKTCHHATSTQAFIPIFCLHCWLQILFSFSWSNEPSK